MEDKAFSHRITRDISDGLMLIDTTGMITFINPGARSLLNDPNLTEGTSYNDFWSSDKSGRNDDFHQYVFDSIYDKDNTHSGSVTYTDPSGNTHYFLIHSSFAFSDDKKKRNGIILQFSDITQITRMKIKYMDAVKILVAMVVVLSFNNLVVALWEATNRPVDYSVITIIIELIGGIGTLFALKYTSISVQDLGLGKGVDLRKSILIDSLITAAVLSAVIIIKLILRSTAPHLVSPDAPLFNFNIKLIPFLLYPFTVVAQELLTRGAAQGCLTMVLPDGIPEIVPIIISSLFFGALHIHRGLMFMVGAMVLLSVFGLIYNRQKTIWGLCIPHYFLGLMLPVLLGAAA